MKVKLTRRAIDALKPPTSGYVLVLDSELPNFGVRVTAAGVRSYYVERRLNGRTRRITIAKDGVLTPELARTEARKLLGKLATGIDPMVERARARAESVTLHDAFEAYLEARHNLKPLTIHDQRRAMADLGWSRRQIASITPDIVQRRHAELGERSPARANLTMRYLRAWLNFASEKYADADGRPVLPVNPVRRLSKARAWYRVERRRTVLKEHDLKPWVQAVAALPHTEARDFFMLALLTGLRRGEALNLRWEHVDLRARTLTIPDPKNRRPHALPLSDFLADLLERRSSETAGEYVFQSGRGRLQNLRYAMDAVERDSGVSFCVHDLRRTFATAADRLDIPAYAVKALLNHSGVGDVTAGYVVTDVERLRRPMQRITDYFLAASELRASAVVTELPKAHKVVVN